MMQAKRVPPKNIVPIVIDNMKIEVVHWGKERGLGQNGGYIAAVDVKTGEELWLLKIYDVIYEPKMEEDVQDIFIKKMSKAFFSDKIKIVDEEERKYLVDPKAKTVELD